MTKAKTVEAVHTHTHTHTSNSIKENKGRNTFCYDMQITDYLYI